jgi:hypothetical protein
MSKTIDESEVAHLPICTSTTALGVVITVHQRADHAAQRGLETPGGLGPDPEIEAPTGHHLPRVRRELAAWARRNLFDGAGG